MLLTREFGYRMLLYRRTWRLSVVLNFVNPVLFLVGIGYGLGRLVGDTAGVGYLEFLAPGLLVASAMQTSAIETTMVMYESLRTRGSYRAAAMTPLGPADIFAGHLLFIGFRVLSTSAAFFLVMVVLGTVRTPMGLLAVPVALLTSVAIAMPFAVLAMTIENAGVLNGIRNVIMMPLYLLAGTFVPISQLPEPLQPIAQVLPLTFGVEVGRGCTTGMPSEHTLMYLLALTAIAAVGTVAARYAFRRALTD
ncbi:MAG: ABC transporter permease [Kibdelosporangium sp.]